MSIVESYRVSIFEFCSKIQIISDIVSINDEALELANKIVLIVNEILFKLRRIVIRDYNYVKNRRDFNADQKMYNSNSRVFGADQEPYSSNSRVLSADQELYEIILDKCNTCITDIKHLKIIIKNKIKTNFVYLTHGGLISALIGGAYCSSYSSFFFIIGLSIFIGFLFDKFSKRNGSVNACHVLDKLLESIKIIRNRIINLKDKKNYETMIPVLFDLCEICDIKWVTYIMINFLIYNYL
jgi:hypothetical protein